ncbi:hypothetical protein M408DRAFT_18293 [Serendipita vermifera MAFF 305830]|uniref:ferric-chelate reductase (NADPH) n=1 Tax=Serendipita vermifera MAFF 305830 TaxID=933852 RepID=A0A0C3AP60_SERVB|nr:hypothetical protein M408DRAFT_18293 [Serendipita vermifera MAFF 305830]
MHGHGGGHEMNGHYVPTGDEMMEYQSTREPWAESVKYGYYTIYFCGAMLGVFFLINGLKAALFWSKMRNNSPTPTFKSKIIATARLLSYPRLPYPTARIVNYLWAVGPLGPNILLFIGFLYFNLYCWVNPWYYRLPFYGSPPLGLRSEWIATALLPFVFVLGAKRNLISWITGVSHDKLQVFHQGAAFVVVYMSLVHTISMTIQSLMEVPWADTYASSYIYWTGFAALGALLWLYIGSLPFVRKRLYEGFYLLHIAASIMFIGFLYAHGLDLLDTNAYMQATIGLFGFGIVVRIIMMFISNVLFRHRAQVSLQSGSIRMTIPTNMKWSPGMHIFIRFLHVRPFESHPFTIASIPASTDSEQNEMVFVIRPEGGFTRVLAEVAATVSPERKFPVILDGPYGDEGHNSLRAYNHVLLLAGGTGITFIAPLLADLVRAIKQKDGPCKKVDLVWAVKNYDAVKNFESEFLEMSRDAGVAGGTVTLRVHVTGDAGDEEKHADTPSSEKGSVSEEVDSSSLTITRAVGRPDIRSIIAQKGSHCSGQVGVAVCGPLSLMTDASNAVSNVQLDILRGRASCTEMYLRSETFGW